MKTDYGLRPNEKHETEVFGKIVEHIVSSFDQAEQSYFRENPGEILKNTKCSQAVRMAKMVVRVHELRTDGMKWPSVRNHLIQEFGHIPCDGTLRKYVKIANA
jgi:hypothetical protein